MCDQFLSGTFFFRPSQTRRRRDTRLAARMEKTFFPSSVPKALKFCGIQVVGTCDFRFRKLSLKITFLLALFSPLYGDGHGDAQGGGVGYVLDEKEENENMTLIC